MKNLLLLFALSFFAFSCSKEKKKSSDVPYVSDEKQRLGAAMTKALGENKKILIKVGAAWCNPCMALDEDIEKNQESFDELLKNYEFLALEEMHWHAFSGTMDFIAGQTVAFYPSMFVVDPAKNQWTYFSPDGDVEGIRKTLEAYEQKGELGSSLREKILPHLKALSKDNTDVFADWDILWELSQAVLTTSWEADRAVSKEFFDIVLAKMTEHPDSFSDFFRKSVFSRSLQVLSSRGVFSAEEIRSNYATVLKSRRGIRDSEFRGPLGQLISQQGYSSSSYNQCEELSESYSALYEATYQKVIKKEVAKAEEELAAARKSLSEAQAKEDQEAVDVASQQIEKAETDILSKKNLWLRSSLMRKMDCLLVGAHGNVVSAEKIAKIRTEILQSEMSEKRKNVYLADLSYIYAASGDFSSAIELNEARKVDRKKYYAEHKADIGKQAEDRKKAADSLAEELDALKKQLEEFSGEEEKRKELEEEIATKTDQLEAAEKLADAYATYYARIDGLASRVIKALEQLGEAWANQSIVPKTDK